MNRGLIDRLCYTAIKRSEFDTIGTSGLEKRSQQDRNIVEVGLAHKQLISNMPDSGLNEANLNCVRKGSLGGSVKAQAHGKDMGPFVINKEYNGPSGLRKKSIGYSKQWPVTEVSHGIFPDINIAKQKGHGYYSDIDISTKKIRETRVASAPTNHQEFSSLYSKFTKKVYPKLKANFCLGNICKWS